MHRFVKGEPNWVEPLNQNFEEAAAHAAGRDNPHGVTAEQLGAPTKAYVDAQLSNKAEVGGCPSLARSRFFRMKEALKQVLFGIIDLFAQTFGRSDRFVFPPNQGNTNLSSALQ